MAGGGKLVSRLAQMPKIQKGISYFRKARTALANSHLGMLARESYGATKNFFTSRFGSLWDDFSRKKFAFAGLDDFRYGDDIGKHTARLYQSTGEGAEYQRISRGLYSEAAEQSGRKISQEFRQEASEQLAKHGDDILVEPYKTLRRNKEISGQAHHLNQNAAFKDVIPQKEGLSIKLEGNVRKDIGSPHYKAHKSLEEFWDQYRKGGELHRTRPTMAEYNVALEKSLVDAGLTPNQAKDVLSKAMEQQISYGLTPEKFVPRIPGKMYLPK